MGEAVIIGILVTTLGAAVVPGLHHFGLTPHRYQAVKEHIEQATCARVVEVEPTPELLPCREPRGMTRLALEAMDDPAMLRRVRDCLDKL